MRRLQTIGGVNRDTPHAFDRSQARKHRARESASHRTPAAEGTYIDPARFLGTWEVRRKVVDFRGATRAVFVGRVSIEPSRFHETGRLTLGSAVLNATREYRLHFDDRAVVVRYGDGSDFITLTAAPAQIVRHECGDDLYVGRFFFRDQDTWAEAWRVVGPRKHYASVSHYRRLPGAD